MKDLTKHIKVELLRHGADIVGIGDLTELSPDVRHDLPVGICVAVKYPNAVIQGISNLPTRAYSNWYIKLNERLDELVTLGAGVLQAQGHTAIAMTRANMWNDAVDENTTILPHKTVATRAGIGWIGKCALLVTEQYGSMIRISSILTDAPLKTAKPVNQSKCGNCMVCRDACPAEAISGIRWSLGLSRDEFFDSARCRKMAEARAFQGFGGGNTLCGKCIEVCPFTRRVWEN